MGEQQDKYYRPSRWTYSGRQERAIASSTSSYNTKLPVTKGEDAVLELVGAYLFSHTLSDWKDCKAGVSDKERKAKLRPLLGDRYAYAIVQRSNEQLALQKRNIEADRVLKEAENKALDKRAKQARKWREKHPGIVDKSGKKPTKKQYNPLSYEEWGRYRTTPSAMRNGDATDITRRCSPDTRERDMSASRSGERRTNASPCALSNAMRKRPKPRKSTRSGNAPVTR